MMESGKISTARIAPEIIRLSFGIEQANTYFLVSDGHALVIDVCSKSIGNELFRRELVPDYVILTHEHVDHLWGLNTFREQYPEVKVIAQKKCSRAIINPKTNKAAQYRIYAVLRFGEAYKNVETENRKYHCEPADIVFEKAYELTWAGCAIKLIHAPGHSPGSSMVLVNDEVVFSGDTMLNEDTFLKFDDGDTKMFYTITASLINAMNPDVKIFPGHGAAFTKKDWKRKQNG